MRVIGIDPGSYTLGYGIVEEVKKGQIRKISSGTIKVPKGLPPEKRLSLIYSRLTEIIDEFKPQEASIEEVFFSKNVKTALSLGQVRGVVFLCLCQKEIALYQYSASEVKRAITGYGRADKYQVQSMVRNILELDDLPGPDEADALAIALCHINSRAYPGGRI